MDSLIFLGIGGVAAIAYASTITIGWMKTRKARKLLQNQVGISSLPVVNPDDLSHQPVRYINAPSIKNNHFLDGNNKLIDTSSFDIGIADTDSSTNKNISSGNLIMWDKATGEICYCFEIPNISKYR